MTRRPLVFLGILALAVSASAADPFIQVSVGMSPIGPPVEGKTVAVVSAIVTNHTDASLPGVDVIARLSAVFGYPPTTKILAGQSDANWSCGHNGTLQTVRCSIATLPAKTTLPLTFYIDPAVDARLELQAYATWKDSFNGTHDSAIATQRVAYLRSIPVTHTGDSGPGSLRDALRIANDDCNDVPCSIDFRIPNDGHTVQTIRPQTPLPVITARDLTIDGATQTIFAGDTNPLGPEIALDGGSLWEGHGLALSGSGFFDIRHLAIGGFPWDGVSIRYGALYMPWNSVLGENYIGTDATGRIARPNGSRGLAIDEHSNNFTVYRNLISGNARSGIFVVAGSDLKLNENRIGVDRDGGPLPNGASGIFIGSGFTDLSAFQNHIAYNRHFGIAVARSANHYQLTENTITRNVLGGIDVGLDGFSGYSYDDFVVERAFIPPPRLTGAHYDAATNTTTITGTYFPHFDHWGTFSIELFANDVAESQGQIPLGQLSADDDAFTHTVPGDLRGKFLTATGSRSLNLGWSGAYAWTSEFSDTLEVH